MSYIYEDRFFDYVDIGSSRSARHVIAAVRPHIAVCSVLDVGCGRGTWLAEWQRAGIADVQGVDGSYVSTAALAVPAQYFRALDVSCPFDLERQFDLVQSLEVAEHIAADCAEIFIDNLCRHGDLILFSAAVPGQGGEHHINEQPYEYWREKFRVRCYRVFDFVRAAVAGNRQVEPWYRYNALLFARDNVLARLDNAVQHTQIPDSTPVPDVAPLTWRLRNATLRRMPASLVQWLVALKHLLTRAAPSTKG
jgi:SAM-dependent methyltransferase